jgi:hypothetical protein
MSEQLQRYAAAAAGGAIAVVWATAGIDTALACVLAAAASYGAAVFLQRREVAPRRRAARAPRRAVPRPKPEVVFAGELPEPDSQASATGSYGW